MYDDSLNFESRADRIIKGVKRSSPTIDTELRFEGYNEDITESYYWFFNFAYYTGKGYTTLKLEDYHHFSENSQFGAQLRQIKGGSIRAFQENLNQLIQLIKVHLFPLLKEVKQADFYYRWINKIVENDEIVQKLKSRGVKDDNLELKKAREERNEAISHLKDKWVNEVDGGRLWQMQRSSNEQGLDFSLLPQLFFGTSLDDPLEKKKTIKAQLDEDIYSIDITRDAKEGAARMMYRFYNWLPSAIKDTQTTFRIKIATLKQMYSTVQMHINFMKPLLMEINRKTEGMNFENIYRGFEDEHPDLVSLFDSSFWYVKTLGIKGYERGKYKFSELEFTNYGLFIERGSDIINGPCKGKKGFIAGEEKGKYIFYPCDKKDISQGEFEKLKKELIDKDDLAKFSCIQLEFNQIRRTEVIQSQQGPQQVPYMKNTIKFKGFAWNMFEIAAYRQQIKNKGLDLIENYVKELKEIKEDLLYYANYFEGKEKFAESDSKKEENKTNNNNNNNTKSDFDNTIFIGPFKGLYEIFKPVIPTFSLPEKSEAKPSSSENTKHKKIRLNSIDDTWKLYSIFKKSHGYMQY